MDQGFAAALEVPGENTKHTVGREAVSTNTGHITANAMSRAHTHQIVCKAGVHAVEGVVAVTAECIHSVGDVNSVQLHRPLASLHCYAVNQPAVRGGLHADKNIAGEVCYFSQELHCQRVPRGKHTSDNG